MSTATISRCPLEVERLPIRFECDEQRVIARLFLPGGETRIRHIIQRVDRLTDAEVRRTVGQVLSDFGRRHWDLEATFEEHYEAAIAHASRPASVSRERRLLIGACFTMEYSIESAALFNPSVVEHPNQSGIPDGALRFLMSFRATGEGHISSVVFRSGVIEANQTISIEASSKFSRLGRISTDKVYEKRLFRRKLQDIGLDMAAVDLALNRLPEHFPFRELERSIDEVQTAQDDAPLGQEVVDGILWLAQSNYQLDLPTGARSSEIVIFPQSESESGGIEDLRMVRFIDDDGSIIYFGTYTAYNGYRILPQLMESTDLAHISIHTLNGAQAQNKGMALFPRRINGHYAMCSRIDGENLYIMYSDMIHFWESAKLLDTPKQPWEFIQIGNCGSPLETPEGWLLLTHGVGPMRRYCIGAILLDLDDPLKVIGSLDEPLLMPSERERDGYVPNVVYTCGAMIHRDQLYIPYGISDAATSMAVVSMKQLLERLVN